MQVRWSSSWTCSDPHGPREARAAISYLLCAPSEPSTTAKPASQVGVEAPGQLGDFIIGVSGQAETAVIRHSDARRIVMVYDLQGQRCG